MATRLDGIGPVVTRLGRERGKAGREFVCLVQSVNVGRPLGAAVGHLEVSCRAAAVLGLGCCPVGRLLSLGGHLELLSMGWA